MSWLRWPKYWSFSFRLSPSSEYSGLISFRIAWLDLLAVKRTLKSLLHDLNQIPYDYTVEDIYRFKGLDLIECLKNYGQRFITLYRRQ